jgi:predicted transcriptional regulator
MAQPYTELAENKLSILYYVQCLGIPLTNSQIIDYFLENNLINYFDLQQFLIDLVSGGFLDCLETRSSNFFGITPKGTEILNFFKKRIPATIRESIESFADINREHMRKESQITADYAKIYPGEYEVTCKVIEKELTLMELKINVATSQQAKTLCNNWKTGAPEIYRFIIQRLVHPDI